MVLAAAVADVHHAQIHHLGVPVAASNATNSTLLDLEDTDRIDPKYAVLLMYILLVGRRAPQRRAFTLGCVGTGSRTW
jgi:hypothetical protein